MKRNKETSGRRKKDVVVLLADLAPRGDVKGGAGRLFFGERLEASEGAEIADEPSRERTRGGEADGQGDEAEDDAEGEGPRA